MRDSAVADALRLIDVLIDGVYVESRNNGHLGMHGSDNQRVHHLTDRYKGESYFETYDRDRFEMRPAISGETMLVGVPSRRASDLWTILGPTTEEQAK